MWAMARSFGPADPDRRTTGRQHLGDETTARIIEAYSEGGFEYVE